MEELPVWHRRPGESEDELLQRVFDHPYTSIGLAPPRRASASDELSDDVDEIVALRIFNARRAEGVSQRELAASVGMTQMQLSRIERAESSVRIGELVALARELRRSLDWFVDD